MYAHASHPDLCIFTQRIRRAAAQVGVQLLSSVEQLTDDAVLLKWVLLGEQA